MTAENVSGISDWLAHHGLGNYAPVFADHDVDLATLSELTYEHLREMGLPIGACLRIAKALAAPPATPVVAAGQEIAQALAQVVTERRQVTVMFCDIVGSTKLAADLDPEEMRLLLLGYWKIIESTAARHQGYIAQHLGDGALIYFGYPTAQENDAEQAVHAGLALLRAISETAITARTPLQVRIGLATGTVVINQFMGGSGKIETLAIGQSVNFASRLQSLALPGNLVIDAPTKALVGGLFSIEDIGRIAVDGFDEPAALFKVTGAKRVRSRFEARQPSSRATFRGRQSELEQALDCWQKCRRSSGQMVLVRGEPGIGKSRFVQELIARIGQDAGTQVLLQCAAHSSSSPLFPLIESLSMLANTSAAETRAETQGRLRAMLAVPGEAGDLLLDLFDPAPAPPTANPQLRRNLTLLALVDWFAAKCARGPVLVVIEDLHLCDPTTLEFLERLVARACGLPILILATARPAFAFAFAADRTTRLELTRLGRGDTDDLVREIFGAQRVSAQLLDIVAERTDGIPLFIEELLKSLSESGAIAQSDRTVGLKQSVDSGAIPRSLQSILTARLDTLRGAKRIAQIAACIGREFSVDLLRAVTALSQHDLQAQLAEITASDLIIPAAQTGTAAHVFRHALVRDAAYGSLLFTERQAIHGQIADALVASGRPVRPEILAHHLTAAQRLAPAVEKWCEAGAAAKLRSADAEAVEHLQRALDVVAQLPQGPARDDAELAVLLDLIAPLRAVRGFAAVDVAAPTARAIALADKAKDARRILPLLYNRWVYSFVTSHRSDCEPMARDILDRSAFDNTNLLRMTGLRAVAATQFTAGHLAQAVQNFDASIAVYDAARQTDLTHAVGLDGKVTALGYCALARWCLGQTELAHAHLTDALATAGRVNHVSTTVFAIYHHALLAGVLERNPQVLRTNGRNLQTLSADNGLAMWLICGRLLESLGDSLDPASSGDLGPAEAHFADFAEMGVVYRPTYHALMAEICLRTGDSARGMSHIETAKSQIDTSGERWNEAEIFRLQGALATDGTLARQCYERASEIARAQGAVIWEARARHAMTRLANVD